MNGFSEEKIIDIVKEKLSNQRCKLSFNFWEKKDSSENSNLSYDFLVNGNTIVEITKVYDSQTVRKGNLSLKKAMEKQKKWIIK